MTQSLDYRVETKTITDIRNLFEDGLLNLEPGFQRQSVWSERDRARLIDSILRNYPLPAIFLYRRYHDGQIVYDVIDGKQRIESILRFVGDMRGSFWVRSQLPGATESDWYNWKCLEKRKSQHLLTGFRLPVVEVNGELGDIIELFVRINSTGKALTPQEKRRAKYYNSAFLKEADRIARKWEDYFSDMGIISPGQVSRMKHVELICELMLSVHQGDVINKKAALDRVMSADSINGRQITNAAGRVVRALNRVDHIFPKLYTTRLKQLTDYYSLVVLVAKFEANGLILTDKRRNKLAWDLLSSFAVRVDEVREKQRKAIGIKPEQEIYRDYLLTVSQMTDDIAQRRRREAILGGIIGTLFAKKDAQRGFTAEQRRIMWNTSASRKCESCGCILSWDDFTIDHIDPHSKGGRSRLENAALMCRSCNSRKRDRRR